MCTTRAPVAVSQRSAEQVTALFNATLIVPQDSESGVGTTRWV